MKLRAAFLLILLLAACQHAARGGAAEMTQATLVTASGAHVLDMEVAATPENRARGLMYRQSLDGIDGMFFLFDGYRNHAMWMKNTYISLDILFIDKDGAVTTVILGAEPLSTTVLPSNGPAKAAIELPAGDAARLGVEIGDIVRHPWLGTADGGG